MKKTIIFDMDETLIHCLDDYCNSKCDTVINMSFPDGTSTKAGLNIRPFARRILKELKKDCEIIVFSASHKDYMDPILDFLDPTNQLIDHRFHRDYCIQNANINFKDLRIFKNRSLS